MIALSTASPAAGLDAYRQGYRDCTPRRLAVCQNSNQLVWNDSASPRKPTRKSEFVRALYRFLQGAPRIRLLKYSWSAAQIALDSFTGPGGKPTQFENGDWFADGFQPHAASERAAVIFDRDGKITIVATLSTGGDATSPGHFDTGDHILTIYARDDAPPVHHVRYLRDWAAKAMPEMPTYPGPPENRIGAVRMVMAAKGSNHWTTRALH